MVEKKKISVVPIRRVYICGSGKCIDRSSAEKVFERLRGLVSAHQLDDFSGNYRVKVYLAGCLDICRNGVTLVIQPDGIFYWNVDEAKAENIFFQHLLNDQPVEDLLYYPD